MRIASASKLLIVRSGCYVWTPRRLQGIPRDEVLARRVCLGKPYAAELYGSAVGRLEAVRLWPRDRPWGLQGSLETKQVFLKLDETPVGWY